jgi:hypothetical protein
VILGPVLRYFINFSLNASLLKLLGSQEKVIIMSDEVASDILLTSTAAPGLMRSEGVTGEENKWQKWRKWLRNIG